MKWHYKNVQDAAKAVLRGNFIQLNTYIRKEEISKTNNLSFYFRIPEKEERIKFKIRRGKEIIQLEQKSMKLNIRHQKE